MIELFLSPGAPCVCWLCLCASDMHPYIIFILFGSRQDVISFVCRLFTLDFHHSALCTHVSANLWCHRFVKMLTDLFNVQPVFFSSQKYYFTCLLVYIANRDYFNHCFWHASWGLVAIIVNSNFTTYVRRKSNYTYFRCSNPFFMHAFLSVGIVWLLIFGFLFSYLQGLYDCSSFFHLKLAISFDILCFKLFLRFLPFG